MALINCPECNKEVSDKAVSCPNCGLPITFQSQPADELQVPDLPSDLSIGKQIVNWSGNAAFEGEYLKDENVIADIPTGKVKVLLHTHGINITSSMYKPLFQIHNLQIISIKKTSRAELIKIDKSVIGRAFVGGLILGPLAAVVGGMSGIGAKERMIDKSYLVINYWDTKLKTPNTLLIGGDNNKIQQFINRNLKEDAINKTQSRNAEKKKGWFGL